MKNKRERIVYGVFETDLGAMILAQSVQGLCWLGFMVAGYKGDGLSRLKGFFPDAEIARDDAALQTLKDQVLRAWEMGDVGSLLLDLRGTAFQKAVWNA
ncbi:MAG: bifunctional transcriptional activator/DNA repair enzyme protein Ada, partial [Bdellovibrionales bacterium]